MSVPKSVVKFSKNGVTYTSSVDRVSYTILELTRAALRDAGKFLARTARAAVKRLPGSRVDKLVRWKSTAIIYKIPWAKSGLPHLEIGAKLDSWYTEEHELGTSGQPRRGILTDTAHDNIAKIIEIQSQYLSALEDEAEAHRLIDEQEYTGGGEDE